jgi:nicotinic acid mononucleotide adenylyltransferase/nicotinamide mononucleotide (NMN) deamidase PncC
MPAGAGSSSPREFDFRRSCSRLRVALSRTLDLRGVPGALLDGSVSPRDVASTFHSEREVSPREIQRTDPPWDRIVADIHASGRQIVVAVTGGGSGAIGQLLQVPGASRSILEAIVPYASASLADWLGGAPEQACSSATARAMAMAAFLRSRELAPHVDPRALVGVGCTASLATDRLKRGAHRVHVAVQTSQVTQSRCFDASVDGEDRALQEVHAAGFLIGEIAAACGGGIADIAAWLPTGGTDGASSGFDIEVARPARSELLLGLRSLAVIKPQSAVEQDSPDDGPTPLLVFPGAFNPPHVGHMQMAALAERRLARPLAWELSVLNVDKPPLDFIDIRTRVHAIRAEDPDRVIALTSAPTFREKAALFPAATFVVGADTIRRVGDSKYYGDAANRDRAIAEIAALGCRFLVFGRHSDTGFQTLRDLELPRELRALCDEVPASEFREDISSTQLRSARGV